MGALLVSLIPLVAGVVMSPLAIMALVAVLVSQHPRRNGLAYLVGWILAIVFVFSVTYFVIGLVHDHEKQDPPLWFAVVKVVLGVVLIIGAVFTYRRGAAKVREMAVASTPAQVVAAAPQLPGWLKAVDHFTPGRSGLLGFGIFALNPVDASCTILAAIAIRGADIPTADMTVATLVFAIIGVAPIAIPVVFTLVKGKAADPMLAKIRDWIAGHTKALNAALLLLIGAMQLQSGLSTIFGAY